MLKFEKFLGQTITLDTLKQFFKNNGAGSGQYKPYDEYIVYFYVISNEPEIMNKLKVSDKRRELWFKRDIDLRLYIWVDQNLNIKGIKTFKYQEIYAGHGKSQIVEMDLIQDEVKIINRFIDMIFHNNI